MKRKKNNLFVLLAVLLWAISEPLSHGGASKKCIVYGTVQSNDYKHLPLSPVSVQLVFPDRDTLYTFTNKAGEFILKTDLDGPAMISLFLVGYERIDDAIDISSGTNILLYHLSAVEELSEARIVKEKNVITVSKDTVIIDASSLGRKATDSGMDLLRQVPGIKVSGKRITFNNNAIKRVYVNGVILYGNDISTALNSLYADQIARFQIYREESEANRRAGRHGQKETVLNIETITSFLSALDLNLAAAIGTESRYSLYQNAGFFSEDLVINESAFSDNTNPMLIEVSSLDPTTRGAISSDQRQSTLNFSLEKHWKDRLYGNSAIFNYKYDAESDNNAHTQNRKYFDTEDWTNLFYLESDSIKSSSGKHRLSFMLDFKETAIKNVSLWGNMECSDSENSTINNSTWVADALSLHSSRQRSNLHNTDWKYRGGASWSTNDYLRIIPRAYINYTISQEHGYSSAADTTILSSFPRNLKTNWGKSSNSIGGGIDIRGVLSNNENNIMYLDNTGQLECSRSYYKRDGYDYYHNVVDTYNTDDLKGVTLLGRLSSVLTWISPKATIYTGLVAGITEQDAHDIFPKDNSISRCYFSICPSINATIGQHWNFSFITNANQPDLLMLRERPDNSNQGLVTTGNNGLEQEYSLKSAITYNRFNPGRNSSAAISLSYEYVDGSICSNLYTDSGRIVSSYSNVDGKQDFTVNASFDKLYPKKKLTLQTSLRAGLKATPSITSGNTIYLNTEYGYISQYIRWQYRQSFFINATYQLGLQNQTTAEGFNSNALTHNITTSSSYSLVKDKADIVLRYNLTGQQILSGYGKDVFSHDLSASISYWPIKRTLCISLSGHDLLSQTNPYSYIVKDAYEEISSQTSFGRYLMVNIRYVFKSQSSRRFGSQSGQ